MTKAVLSIVLPLFNEEDTVERCLTSLVDLLNAGEEPFEIICVDDGSSDSSPEKVNEVAKEQPRVRLIQLSRNFGKEAAIVAGLEAAQGKAVIVMDADRQHPPEIVPKFVKQWKLGAQIVSGVKEDRGQEGLLHALLARLFNSLMSSSIGRDMSGASDFKLLDRQVVDILLDCPERTRFFRGLVAWSGFNEERVPFKVGKRFAGKSKWSLFALMRYFKNNILSFSSLPLKLIAYVGFITILFGVLLGLNSLQQYYRGVAVTGFTTVILLQVILFGVLQTSVGIIAFYISTMYEEIKRRPTYIVCKPRASKSEEGEQGNK